MYLDPGKGEVWGLGEPKEKLSWGRLPGGGGVWIEL